MVVLRCVFVMCPCFCVVLRFAALVCFVESGCRVVFCVCVVSDCVGCVVLCCVVLLVCWFVVCCVNLLVF